MLRSPLARPAAFVPGLFLCLNISLTAQAETLYVDDDAPFDPGPGDVLVSDPLEDGSLDHPYDSIQQAMNAAEDGDVIMIRDGLYTGPTNRRLMFAGLKTITVRSESGDPSTCIIDCETEDRGVAMAGGDTSTLMGLTFVNGAGSTIHGIPGEGAGIRMFDSSPTIANCVFSNCVAGWGGAAYVVNSAPTFTSCTFQNCSVSLMCEVIIAIIPCGSGGGMYCVQSQPMIEDCSFMGNSSNQDSAGLFLMESPAVVRNCTFDSNSANGATGMLIRDTDSVLIDDCTFIDNHANQGGAAISTAYSTIDVVRSTFSKNTGDFGYGGAANIGVSDVRFVNCEFAGNTCPTGGAMQIADSNVSFINTLFAGNEATNGGAVRHAAEAVCAYVNCTFADNVAVESAGALLNELSSDVTIENSILWTNTPSDIVQKDDAMTTVSHSTISDGWRGRGVFSIEPMFIDAAKGDYRLSPDSDLIDQGSSDALPDDALDLDGDRVVDEPLPIDLAGLDRIVGESVDLGAFEVQAPSNFADFDGDGVVGPADLAQLLGAWGPNPGDPADLDGDGSVGPADLAQLLGGWG